MANQMAPNARPHGVEALPQRLILASRWLLLVFYFVLVLALALFAAAFVVHFVELVPKVIGMAEIDIILEMLSLVDGTLVASLVIMVIISGYDNFISPISTTAESLPWIGSLDASGLKIKIATSIVAIASIELLESMLNANRYTSEQIAGAIALQLAFVVSAVGLGVLDRLTRH